MAGLLVLFAPQCGMLRHGEQHDAAGFKRFVDLRQHRFVFVYMFDDIEGTECIELRFEGNVARVHLDELRARYAARGVGESSAEYFRAHQFSGGVCAGDVGEHEAGAAAYLHKGSERRCMATQQHQDEAVARLEPEVAFFQSGQLREVFGVEAVARIGELYRQCGVAIGYRWCGTASGADPFRAVVAGITLGADLHSGVP